MYGAKRGYKKRPARKGGKGVSRLTKAKPTAITALAKAVKSIQLKMKRKTLMLNYGQIFNQNLSGDLEQFKLSNYSSWSRIFGTGADDESANKMIHKSFGLDMYFQMANEVDNTQFTVFLVSLKDSIRASAFNNSTGTLSLSSGVDYQITGGLVLLNKKSFNIHGVRRFQLGNNGNGASVVTAQQQYGIDRRLYMKLSFNKSVENVAGNWKDLTASPDPSDNYYLLVFNDNSVLDLQSPTLRLNVVHTIEQLA